MTMRTTEAVVTFSRPFTLKSVGESLPSGTYRVVTDEEQIGDVSYLAFRRIAVMLHVPATSEGGRSSQMHLVSASELDAALDADQQASSP